MQAHDTEAAQPAKLQLLGTPALVTAGSNWTLPQTAPARLVALLALRGAAVSRGELAGILFPDEAEDTARQRLRLQLSRARKLHPGIPLLSSRHYASCIIRTDVHDLLEEAQRGDWKAVSSGPAPRLLGSWDLPAGLAAELRPLQVQLQDAWLDASRRYSQELAASGQPSEAFTLLARALRSEPTAEDLLQLLLQIAPAAGKSREAGDLYQEFCAEVEPLEPLPRTARLYRELEEEAHEDFLPLAEVRHAAAALGEHATPARIAGMLNSPIGTVVALLAKLERAGELDGQGRLLHAQAVLHALPMVQRRYLHGQAARALSHAGLPFAEGEQWLLAGDSERAVAAWFPATTILFGRESGQQEEAVAVYRRILDLPVRSPAWYAASAYYAGAQLQYEGPEPALQRVEQVLHESDDAHARTFALLVRSHIETANGDLARAAATLELSEEQARGTQIVALQRDVLHNRVRILSLQGKTREALALVNRTLEALHLEPPRLARLSWLAAQASLHCDLGEFDSALESYREQLQLARSLGYRREEMRVVSDIIATLNDIGRPDVEHLELGLRTLQLGEFDVSWPLRLSLAEGYAALGNRAEALAQLKQILQSGDATLTTRGHAVALQLRLGGSDPVQAERAGELALSTDLPQVRVAIAAALATLQHPPAQLIGRILEGVTAQQVPAWLSSEWEELAGYHRQQLIRY